MHRDDRGYQARGSVVVSRSNRRTCVRVGFGDQALYRNDAIEPRTNANGRELNP